MNKIPKPKILYMDIETSPCLVYTWGLGKQVVGIKQLKKDRKIISIGYMFEGDKKVTVLRMDMKKHKINKFDDDADKQMLIDFVKIYNSADLVIAHNGRRFDLARIRARLVKYQLPDIYPICFDDSYGFCKNIDFTSHKLDYIGRYLSTGQKDSIDYQEWINVMEGSKKSLDKICKYMKTDVLRLQAAYKRLKPYAKSKLNMSIFTGQPSVCSSCGSSRLVKDGFHYTNLGRFQSFECKSCGKKCQSGKNLIVAPRNYMRSS